MGQVTKLGRRKIKLKDALLIRRKSSTEGQALTKTFRQFLLGQPWTFNRLIEGEPAEEVSVHCQSYLNPSVLVDDLR